MGLIGSSHLSRYANWPLLFIAGYLSPARSTLYLIATTIIYEVQRSRIKGLQMLLMRVDFVSVMVLSGKYRNG